MDSLSEQAKVLHQKMTSTPATTLFNQQRLLDVMNIKNPVDLLTIAQELVNQKLIKLIKQGDELMFQALSVSEATKITSMNEDEAMIYTYIEASGREGIWTKTIKAKTNLHQHVVVRCLKSLENQRYIKSIKSVKHPTRKIYMLYNLQPSIDVTGGPWFTDSELDSEFIDSLLGVIWKFVASKSYPYVFKAPTSDANVFHTSFPYNYTGYVDINAIMDFILNSGVTNVDLAIHDIRSLCDVLVFDDKLELVHNTFDQYKATWQSIVDAGFGKNYEKKENQTSEVKEFLNDEAFSIFNNRQESVIDEEEGDLVYFDSWIKS